MYVCFTLVPNTESIVNEGSAVNEGFRSIVESTLSASVLRAHSGAAAIIPSTTRAAGGLVARRCDHGLSSRLSNIPVFSEFHNASTKTPHSLRKVTVFWGSERDNKTP